MCDACKDWGQPMPEYIKSPGGLRLLFHALPTAKEMQIADGGMKSGMKDAEDWPKTEEGWPESGMKSAEGWPKTEEGWPKGGKKTANGGKKSGKKNEEGGKKSGKKTALEIAFYVGNIKYVIPQDSIQGILLITLIEDNFATYSKLMRVTGISRSAIQKHLNKLREYGIIKRVGPDKGGYWECIAPENGGPETKTGGPESGPEMERGSQKTNIGSQKTDDGGQKSGQKTNGGGQKSGQIVSFVFSTDNSHIRAYFYWLLHNSSS